MKFHFHMQTGTDAKDYSSIITKRHLRPAEMQAVKIVEHIKQLRNELGMLVKNEEALRDENDKIKSRVITFGIISVVVMAATTYLQLNYLNNFFRYKKII